MQMGIVIINLRASCDFELLKNMIKSLRRKWMDTSRTNAANFRCLYIVL